MLSFLINICCFLLIVSSLFMLLSKSPVNSVFFLILIFFINSILFILLNGDLIGIFLLIIYVGAIAVLFLFIVMLINLKRIDTDENTYLIIGSFFFFFITLEVLYLILSFFWGCNLYSLNSNNFDFFFFYILDDSNKEMILSFIGWFIFFKNPIFLVFSVIQLVVGIVSSIELTNFKSGYSNRKQPSQLSRNETLSYIYIY